MNALRKKHLFCLLLAAVHVTCVAPIGEDYDEDAEPKSATIPICNLPGCRCNTERPTEATEAICNCVGTGKPDLVSSIL